MDNELSETTSLEFKEVRNAAVTSSAVVEAKREVVLKPGFEVKASETLSYSAKIKASAIASDDYAVYGIDYDANGNIKFLNRNKDKFNNNNLMDKLGYVYKTDKPNQLLRVTDAVTTETNADDIKNQALEENYEYNSIGQLVKNNEENVEYIYTASGLVSEVIRNNVSLFKFFYNDKGFRVRKESFNTQTGALQSTQYYVRDVAGSVMAIYEELAQVSVAELVEVPIYGASRLGVHRVGVGTSYELTDHLGNVRAIVTKDNPTPSMFADYYPGGMQMPNRNSLNGSYRYAYQGQEKDQETGKEAFQLRLYDGRIGRWLTTDPAHQFDSPYIAMGNNPVNAVDPDGGKCIGGDCPQGGQPSVDLGLANNAIANNSALTSSVDTSGFVNTVDNINNFIGYGNTAFGALVSSPIIQNLAKIGDFPSHGVSVYNKGTRDLLGNLGYANKVITGVGFGISTLSDGYKFLPKEYGGAGEIGFGRFLYRTTLNYLGTKTGLAGPLIYGAGKLGELGYDASVHSRKLTRSASAQEIHHGRINSTNMFSRSFWTEVGGHLNMSGMMNGINY